MKWIARKLFPVAACLVVAAGAFAQNQVLGEVQLVGAGKVEKTSGVWVDGQYVGYLDELKSDNKLLLLPGTHRIEVRQSGYKDFSQEIAVEPGRRTVVHVAIQRDLRVQYGQVFAEVKLDVNPSRAAVFLDDRFVGHVQEFTGLGRAMLVSPGKHQLKIALPGYRDFATSIDLLPHQKFTIKTDLVRNPGPAEPGN